MSAKYAFMFMLFFGHLTQREVTRKFFFLFQEVTMGKCKYTYIVNRHFGPLYN